MKNRPKKLNPQEINSQSRRICKTYRCNSQTHFRRQISSENSIILPFGKQKNIDIRDQIPLSHIHDSFIKSEYCSPENKNQKTAYEKALIEETINTNIQKQRHQNLLRKDRTIKNLCHKENMLSKKKIDNKKERLKLQLKRIIADALKFSKKNSAVRAMLPDNIDEIVAQAKKETRDLSMSLNISHVSRISRVSSIGNALGKNEFLDSLGVDMENFNTNNINLDIDKCWNYVVKIAKGRKVEDILRFKVVNTIMKTTEKKSSERARKIYEKLAIYKKYMAVKKAEEKRRKRLELIKKEEELKKDTEHYIKNRIRKSIMEKKSFFPEDNKKNKNHNIFNKKTSLKKNKKMKRISSAGNIIPDEEKKYTMFNAYNDVSKIITFIDSSKIDSQSKVYRNHFANIQTTKNMDKIFENLLVKNDIFN